MKQQSGICLIDEILAKIHSFKDGRFAHPVNSRNRRKSTDGNTSMPARNFQTVEDTLNGNELN